MRQTARRPGRRQCAIQYLVTTLGLLLVIAACRFPAGPAQDEAIPGFVLPPGFEATAVVRDLTGPTQFLVEADALWIAHLNGAEGEMQGQILRFDRESGERTAILNDLDKPTGLARLGEGLYVATRDELLFLDLARSPQRPVRLLTNLPNNGRSNGTLTTTPLDQLLYVTSGTRRDATSGRLWSYDPQRGVHTVVATGLKLGYAHLYDEENRLWIAEIADGAIGGVPIPDEINLGEMGADFGWPRCFGRQLQGPDCDGVRPAATELPVHSTPTGLALSPFADNTLLVALWVPGEVLAFPLPSIGEDSLGPPDPFLEGVDGPQTLVAEAAGSLWLAEFGSGTIWQITGP